MIPANFIDVFFVGALTSTKQAATLNGISTKKAYDLCTQLEKEGKLECFGYRAPDGGTYDRNYTGAKKSSLLWTKPQ